MNDGIAAYNDNLESPYRDVCAVLAKEIDANLPDAASKIWHAHPVWFLDNNPIVGYSKQKKGVRLMFWSGSDFEEDALDVRGGNFKDASIFYDDTSEINSEDIKRWIEKSRNIQWDYKNIVKNKGVLNKIKG